MLPDFQKNKSLSSLSTFGIGGPALYYAEATTTLEMQELLSYCHKNSLPFFVLGKGSNCLFDDRGFNGLVISNKITFIKQKGSIIEVGSGYSFSLLGTQMARQGLSGLEFACGIPGTVGGAVYMNAGAHGKQTADSLKEVLFASTEGGLHIYPKDTLFFDYRTSSFQKMKGSILSATFLLTPQKEARERQLGLISYRKKTQPYGEPSAGCVFRNPQGLSAGALIEKCGLKGSSQGGAFVSPIHANFIVNTGKATAQNVLALIQHIKDEVKKQTEIDLEIEIHYIPYE